MMRALYDFFCNNIFFLILWICESIYISMYVTQINGMLENQNVLDIYPFG
jgi:hypothetical protein